MKKQLLAGAMAAGLVLGGVNIAVANPDPNGPAKKGLCTAYFNGSEQGQEKKREAGPFKALEEAATDDDPETPAEDDVRTFCEGMIGGRPGAGEADSTAPGGGKP